MLIIGSVCLVDENIKRFESRGEIKRRPATDGNTVTNFTISERFFFEKILNKKASKTSQKPDKGSQF